MTLFIGSCRTGTSRQRSPFASSVTLLPCSSQASQMSPSSTDNNSTIVRAAHRTNAQSRHASHGKCHAPRASNEHVALRQQFAGRLELQRSSPPVVFPPSQLRPCAKSTFRYCTLARCLKAHRRVPVLGTHWQAHGSLPAALPNRSARYVRKIACSLRSTIIGLFFCEAAPSSVPFFIVRGYLSLALPRRPLHQPTRPGATKKALNKSSGPD